jgi:hypothetical protein
MTADACKASDNKTKRVCEAVWLAADWRHGDWAAEECR